MCSESNRKIKVLLITFCFTFGLPRKAKAVFNPVIISLIGPAFFWTRSISTTIGDMSEINKKIARQFYLNMQYLNMQINLYFCELKFLNERNK